MKLQKDDYRELSDLFLDYPPSAGIITYLLSCEEQETTIQDMAERLNLSVRTCKKVLTPLLPIMEISNKKVRITKKNEDFMTNFKKITENRKKKLDSFLVGHMLYIKGLLINRPYLLDIKEILKINKAQGPGPKALRPGPRNNININNINNVSNTKNENFRKKTKDPLWLKIKKILKENQCPEHMYEFFPKERHWVLLNRIDKKWGIEYFLVWSAKKFSRQCTKMNWGLMLCKEHIGDFKFVMDQEIEHKKKMHSTSPESMNNNPAFQKNLKEQEENLSEIAEKLKNLRKLEFDEKNIDLRK